MKKLTERSIYNFLIILCMYFAASVSINSDSLNRIALYVAIPLAVVVTFIKRKKIVVNRYEGFLFGLYLWDFFSILWAQYPDTANRELHRILGAILLVYVMSANGDEENLRKYLYFVFILLYVGAWYYSINNSLIVMEQSSDQDRLNDEKLNANTMAYYTFYATMSIFFLADLFSSRLAKISCNILFLGMIPLSFFVALATASRQVLIIQIPLMSLLIYERYIRESKKISKLLFTIAFVSVFVAIMPTALELYDNSYLAVRSGKDIYEDSRWLLLNDAVRVGFEHFPFGVGIGNYINYSFNRHFSHCSFTELFANNGVVGLFLYVYLLWYFVGNQWKYYKRTSDRKFIVFLIFGIIFIADQVFYVFYTDLWLISFFALVAAHSESYYKKITLRTNY